VSELFHSGTLHIKALKCHSQGNKQKITINKYKNIKIGNTTFTEINDHSRKPKLK